MRLMHWQSLVERCIPMTKNEGGALTVCHVCGEVRACPRCAQMFQSRSRRSIPLV